MQILAIWCAAESIKYDFFVFKPPKSPGFENSDFVIKSDFLTYSVRATTL